MQITINNKYISVLESINYSADDVIKEFLMLKLHNKIAEYKSEIKYYSNKFQQSFEKFETYINSIENSEDIDEYNDYLAWKFSYDSLNYYKNQLTMIK